MSNRTIKFYIAFALLMFPIAIAIQVSVWNECRADGHSFFYCMKLFLSIFYFIVNHYCVIKIFKCSFKSYAFLLPSFNFSAKTIHIAIRLRKFLHVGIIFASILHEIWHWFGIFSDISWYIEDYPCLCRISIWTISSP